MLLELLTSVVLLLRFGFWIEVLVMAFCACKDLCRFQQPTLQPQVNDDNDDDDNDEAEEEGVQVVVEVVVMVE